MQFDKAHWIDGSVEIACDFFFFQMRVVSVGSLGKGGGVVLYPCLFGTLDGVLDVSKVKSASVAFSYSRFLSV